MTNRRVPLSFLLQAIVIGLGGVTAAPAMIIGSLGLLVLSQLDGESVDPILLVFLGAGAVILWLAIRALRRGDIHSWSGERWLRLALVPSLAIGTAVGAYLVYRIHASERFLIERDARYLCDKVKRTDDACLAAADKCRRMIGRSTAATTARDPDVLTCMDLELRAQSKQPGSK